MEDTIITSDALTEMAKAGVIYGHKKTKTHPKMREFVAGRKNEIELLDPEATVQSLAKAIEFLKSIKEKQGLVLCVGTLPAQKETLKSFAEASKFPYVVTRWLGGTLTNFKVLRDRSLYYQDLKAKIEKGAMSQYTKKEQLDFSNLVKKMSQFFEGLFNLVRIPDALLVVDINHHDTAVREALRLRIPIIAIIDTDDNPEKIDYPIIANDHAKQSIVWVFGKITEALKGDVSSETK